MKKQKNKKHLRIRFKLVLYVSIIMMLLVSFKVSNQNISIDFFGEIVLPIELELQEGKLKMLTDDFLLKILDNSENHKCVVLQQKGLNSSEENSFKTYVRVVIVTYTGENGSYKILSETNNLNKEDIENYKKNFETDRKNNWPLTNNKLISSNEPYISKIGNYYCTKHNYTRQMGESPPVFVEVIRVQNNDRVHLITFSYRIKDELLWKPVLEKVYKSINIKKF
jgi:hypothetical protein